jgi:hypothetical protein
MVKTLFKNTDAGRMETSAWKKNLEPHFKLHAKLDDKYIENWLSQFTDALEDPEILAKYKRLMKKIKTMLMNQIV